ncbi:MAG: T9SS type A sorting domain-containing protein, partial [Bacteroidales bacterium]|nr:T9SS type A sorting domain-containing protein [Bacteroidales bacterium]
IPNAGVVTFELRNTLGQTIRAEESSKTAGTHHIELDVKSLSNGVYYYTIEYNKQRRTMKMVVNR